MTTPFRHPEMAASPFRLWFNQCSEVDSKYGYTVSDVDMVITKNNLIMILEEKCRMAIPSDGQAKKLQLFDTAFKNTFPDRYLGLFLVRFENTTPDDGATWIGNKRVTKEQFIEFIKMIPEVTKTYNAGLNCY